MTDLQLTVDEIQALKDLLVFLATPKPRTGTDLEGNPMLPVAGEVIDSPWGQATVERLVPRYSTEAVRDASITSPSEGQMSYIVDVDRLDIWDGAEWIPILAVDDADARYVNVGGDLMTGDLTLGEATTEDPTIYITQRTTDGKAWTAHRWITKANGINSWTTQFQADGTPVYTTLLNQNGFSVLSGNQTGPVRLQANNDGVDAYRPLTAHANLIIDPISDSAYAANVYIGSDHRLYWSTAATATEDYVDSLMVKLADRVKTLEAKVAQLEAQLDGP